MLDTLTPRKLLDHVRRGYQALQPARQRRTEAYTLVRGRHPASGRKKGAAKQPAKQPVNLTWQMLWTLVPYLAYGNPAAILEPKRAGLEWDAEIWQRLLTEQAEQQCMGELYAECAIDALLSGISFVDIGLRAGSTYNAVTDQQTDPGELFAVLRTLDDYACDPDARRRSQIRWDAIRYTVSRDECIAGGYYGRFPEETEFPWLVADPDEAAAILGATPEVEYGRSSGERASEEAQSGTGSGENIDEQIELWDVFIRRGREVWVATIPADQGTQGVSDGGGATEKLLGLERMDGPGKSRLEELSFLPDPESLVPFSVEAMQRDIAEIADLLMTKASNQALRSKRNTIVRPGSEDTATAVAKALPDGFVSGDPAALTQIQSGGLMPEIEPAYRLSVDGWNNQTGGAGMVGGQSGVAKGVNTATAYQGVMAQAQGRLQFMQKRVADLASRCLDKQAKLVMTDPMFNPLVGYRPAESVMVDVEWTPEMRSGEYVDFTYKVDAASLPFEDPNVRSARIIDAFTNVVPKIIETCATYGLPPGPMLRMFAREARISNMADIIPDPEALMAQQMLQAAMGEQPKAAVVGKVGRNPVETGLGARAQARTPGLTAGGKV